MAHTLFCAGYLGECKARRPIFRGGRIRLTNLRWTDLVNVNSSVNSSIRPPGKGADREWSLSPRIGNCNDYAVTKRHELIARGWPARALLLSEVATFSGQHHVVVVVRTNIGDLVLDNLTEVIMPWFQKPFQWVRIQIPRNPNFWVSVGPAGRRTSYSQKPGAAAADGLEQIRRDQIGLRVPADEFGSSTPPI
jgi:predicted transglutaminase-like cysteine proteinase